MAQRTVEKDHDTYRSLVAERVKAKKETWPREFWENNLMVKMHDSKEFFASRFDTDDERTQYVDTLLAEMAHFDQTLAHVRDGVPPGSNDYRAP